MVLEYGLRLHVHSLSIHPPPSPPGPAAGVKSLLATGNRHFYYYRRSLCVPRSCPVPVPGAADMRARGRQRQVMRAARRAASSRHAGLQ